MPSPSKREVLERLLGQGMVMVHLDARRPGVRVPPSLRDDAHLRLNLSYRFASHDLSVSDEMVACTLSFSGQPYYCELPIEAIFAAVSHVTGEVWPENLSAMLESQRASQGRLAVVASSDVQSSASAPEAAVPARSHLRLVK